MPSSEVQPKTRKIGGLSISRVPGERLLPQAVRIVLTVGILLIAFHEVVYRQTGGPDYPLFGLVSHAGSDLIIMVIGLTAALLAIPEKK